VTPEFTFDVSKTQLLKNPYIMVLKKFDLYYSARVELPYYVSIFDSIIDPIFNVHQYSRSDQDNYSEITVKRFNACLAYVSG
jgi:hypothetical protein